MQRGSTIRPASTSKEKKLIHYFENNYFCVFIFSLARECSVQDSHGNTEAYIQCLSLRKQALELSGPSRFKERSNPFFEYGCR